MGDHHSRLIENKHLFHCQALGKYLTFCRLMANDAKIVCSRDAQCDIEDVRMISLYLVGCLCNLLV